LNLKGANQIQIQRNHPLIPSWATGPRNQPSCTLSLFPLSLSFSVRKPARASWPSPASRTAATPPFLPPGAADGRVPPVSFPLPLAAPSPGSLRPRRRSPPLRDRSLQPPAPLFPLSSLPRPPLPRVTCQPCALVPAPRQRAVTARAPSSFPPRLGHPRCQALTHAAAARCPPRGRGTDAGHRRLRCPGPCRKP
jgi:hypothetical protein